MAERTDGRGVLYPTRLPSFHRESPRADLRAVVRWFWVPQWDLPPGRTSRQELLPFPASNLVVQQAGVTLSGPTTGASHRDLRGSGGAVGALLRPAGIARLQPDPRTIADDEVPFAAPELHDAVTAAMRAAAMPSEGGMTGRDRALAAFAEWISGRLVPPDEDGLLANAMEEIISSDRSIVRVDQLAQRLGVSMRGVQRLARRRVGLAPLAIIRRYRLQEAAQRLREEPSLSIASVAAELGYADHAHLTADFRKVLGCAPRAYRESSRER